MRSGGELKVEDWTGMGNCGLSLRYFPANSSRKVTKGVPLKGERCLKTRHCDCKFKLLICAEFYAILSPLRIPLSCSPAASGGGEMLVNIEKLTVDIELNDGARGCGQTGFALNF